METGSDLDTPACKLSNSTGLAAIVLESSASWLILDVGPGVSRCMLSAAGVDRRSLACHGRLNQAYRLEACMLVRRHHLDDP